VGSRQRGASQIDLPPGAGNDSAGSGRYRFLWLTTGQRWRDSSTDHRYSVSDDAGWQPGLVQLWAGEALHGAWRWCLRSTSWSLLPCYQFLLVDALVVAPPYNSTDIQALRRLAPDLDDDAVLMRPQAYRGCLTTRRPAVMLPWPVFRDLMAYAQVHGVTHLVVTPRELRTRPGLPRAWLPSLTSVLYWIWRISESMG